MARIIADRGGEAEGYSEDNGLIRHIQFPLCLAIKHEGVVQEICVDFILNISKKCIFIYTDIPLKPGTRIVMHFYIPPDRKLLGEFQGEVVAVNANNPSYPKGMRVKFVSITPRNLKKLEEFLQGKRHLVDEEA